VSRLPRCSSTTPRMAAAIPLQPRRHQRRFDGLSSYCARYSGGSGSRVAFSESQKLPSNQELDVGPGCRQRSGRATRRQRSVGPDIARRIPSGSVARGSRGGGVILLVNRLKERDWVKNASIERFLERLGKTWRKCGGPRRLLGNRPSTERTVLELSPPLQLELRYFSGTSPKTGCAFSEV
jgi:hypothetical protein